MMDDHWMWNDDYAVEPASNPIPFPEACTAVNDAVKIQCRVLDPKSNAVFVAQHVLVPIRRSRRPPCDEGGASSRDDMSTDDDDDDEDSSEEEEEEDSDEGPEVAYMFVKVLQRAMVRGTEHNGLIHCARVLVRRIPQHHRRNLSTESNSRHEEKKESATTSTTTSTEPDAEWELTPRLVAIKELYLQRIFAVPYQKICVKNEVKAMRYIQSYAQQQERLGNPLQHISVPLDVCIECANYGCSTRQRRFLWFVLPYHGVQCDLFYEMSRGPVEEDLCRFYVVQMLRALEELQRMGISHRDLSAENFVLDQNKCLAIDFATNVRVPYGNTPIQRLLMLNELAGKGHYMAPEMLRGDHYDGFAVDLWAIAVLLFRMVAGVFPFEKPLESHDLFCAMSANNPRLFQLSCHYLRQHLQPQMPDFSPELQHLLQRMLALDPTKRLSLRQVQTHPWVTHQALPPSPLLPSPRG